MEQNLKSVVLKLSLTSCHLVRGWRNREPCWNNLLNLNPKASYAASMRQDPRICISNKSTGDAADPIGLETPLWQPHLRHHWKGECASSDQFSPAAEMLLSGARGRVSLQSAFLRYRALTYQHLPNHLLQEKVAKLRHRRYGFKHL